MKKLLLSIFAISFILLLSACEMDNTPTKKVESYLNNYKTLNEDVLGQLDTIVNSDLIMNASQKEAYKDVLKRQYQDLTYVIKDEVIDGNNATVTVEVKVYDYYKVKKEADIYYATKPTEFKDESGNIVESKYIDYKISKMKAYTEKVTYTIDFYLNKIDKTWVLQDINEEVRQKIHGLYAY